jgi:hypothetical protein
MRDHDLSRMDSFQLGIMGWNHPFESAHPANSSALIRKPETRDHFFFSFFASAPCLGRSGMIGESQPASSDGFTCRA